MFSWHTLFSASKIKYRYGLSQLTVSRFRRINPLNSELNPICHLLALLGAHHILHFSRIRVNVINYGA